MVVEPTRPAGPLSPVVEHQLVVKMVSACQLVTLAIKPGKDLQRAFLDVKVAEDLESDKVELRARDHRKETFGAHEAKLGVGVLVELEHLLPLIVVHTLPRH